MQAGWNVAKCSCSACVLLLLKKRNVYPDTCVVGFATQLTDVPALVMCFCVQLLLELGATTPSSPNTVKITKNEKTIAGG